MDNYDTKGLLASKAVWGGIIAVLAGAAGIFGYTVSPEDVESVTTLVTGIGAAVGGLLAVYGRIRATKVIK